MATPKFNCGAECGIDVIGTASAGVEHWSAKSGNVTVVTSPAGFDSPKCFRFEGAASVAALTHTFAAAIGAPATLVGRFKVMFEVFPDAATHLLTSNNSATGIYFESSDNTIHCQANGGNLSSAPLELNTVYEVEFSASRNTVTTTKLKVGGVDYGTSAGASSSLTISTIIVGSASNAYTGVFYIDDICVTGVAGDYPIGSGIGLARYPNADGSHTYNLTTDFGDGAAGTTALAASGSQTDTWQSLQNPLSTTEGNRVGNIGGSITLTGDMPQEWVAFAFEDLPADVASINGVMVVATADAATATTANHRLHFYDGSTTQLILSLDLSETTITIPVVEFAVNPFTGSAWTKSEIDAMHVRFSSSDNNPDVFLHGVCLEVDYVSSSATARPQPFAAAVTTLAPTENVGGVAGVASAVVTALEPTGTGGGGGTDATATPDPLTVTASLLTPTGGAGGVPGVFAAIITMLTPNGVPTVTGYALLIDADNAVLIDADNAILISETAIGGDATATPAATALSVSSQTPLGGAGGVSGLTQALATLLGPTGNVSATPGVVTVLASLLTPLGGAGGVASNLLVLALAQTPSGVGGTGATAQPDPVAVLVTSLAALGGAGGVETQAQAQVTRNTPTGSAGGTASPSQPIVTRNAPSGNVGGQAPVVTALVTRNTPLGGAGGVPSPVTVVVTRNTPSGAGGADATAQPDPVSALVTRLTPLGGAGGIGAIVTPIVTRNTPVGLVTAVPPATQTTVTRNTPLGGAGGIPPSTQVLVTMLQPPAGADASGTAATAVATVTRLAPLGGAGGTSGVTTPTVTRNTPTGGAGGSPSPTQATVTRNTPLGGAGGLAAAAQAVVTRLTPTAATQVFAQPAAASAVITLLPPTGSAGGIAESFLVQVFALSPETAELGLTAALGQLLEGWQMGSVLPGWNIDQVRVETIEHLE
jgi:hypothetical protein